MTNKDGQFKTKIPTAYRTKKNVSIDGDIRKRCPSCNKNNKLIVYNKPQSVNEHDTTLYTMSKCTHCKYIHLVPIE